MIDVAVSTAAGSFCAGGAGLLFYAEKLPGLSKITNRLQTDRIQSALIATAAASLVGTAAGAWWNQTVNNLHDWAVSSIGEWTGLAVTGLPALAVLVVFANDMVTRRVEMRTRILAALLPVLVTTIPGGIGTVFQQVLSVVLTAIGSLFGGLFGLS